MRILHVAAFGPSRNGIYESARDLIRADALFGHTVYFADAGVTENSKRVYVPTGTIDDRANFKVVVSDPFIIDSVDVVVVHNMPQFSWFVKNQVPIVYVVHGRPHAEFKVENSSDSIKSYTFDAEVSQWPRVKKMMYFWPEFKPFWHMFPEEKNLIFDYPVIDQERFCPIGPTHLIKDENRGKWNILLCDSPRDDVDLFEVFNGAIQAARDNKDIKFHYYGIDRPMKACWEVLVQELYNLGAMGELYIRMPHMETIYRSMDGVLTPHRIVTRVIAESLSCGIPVIASKGCKVSQFCHDPHNPHSVSKAITQFVNSDRESNKIKVLEESKKFSFENYSKKMNEIYNEIKIK